MRFFLLFTVLLIPIVALAQDVIVSTPADVANSVAEVVDAVRAGSWIGIAGGLIMLALNLFRLPILGGLLKKIPSRWRIAIPIILGGFAGMFAKIVGGVPVIEAIYISMFTGPTAVFTHEAVFKAIMGKKGSESEG